MPSLGYFTTDTPTPKSLVVYSDPPHRDTLRQFEAHGLLAHCNRRANLEDYLVRSLQHPIPGQSQE